MCRNTELRRGAITTPTNWDKFDNEGRAFTVAGIDGLTLHGLRCPLRSLTERLEAPVGVMAQTFFLEFRATAEKAWHGTAAGPAARAP